MDVLVQDGEKALRDAIDRIKMSAFRCGINGRVAVACDIKDGRAMATETTLTNKTLPAKDVHTS